MFIISSIKKNIIYNIVYQFLAMFIPLITTPYISRTLGVNMIGEYAYAYSTAFYFVLFATLGLGNYGNRSIAEVRDDKKKLSKTFSELYFMQLITSLGVVSMYIIYILFFENNIMTWILSIYVLSSVFDLSWYFFGMEEFKLTVSRNIFIKIFTTVTIFIFIKKPSDIYLYAFIMSSSALISQLIMIPFLKKNIKISKVKLSNVLVHIKPNIILFIPILSVSLYTILDKVMLGLFSTNYELGIYQSSDTIIKVPIVLVSALGTVMLPRIAHLVSNNDVKSTELYFNKSIIFAMFVSSSMCFGIMGVSIEFVPIFFGIGYEKCALILQIILPSCIFLAFSNVVRTQYLIPRKKDNIYIISVFVGAIINIIINLLLIPKFASVGASIGTFCAEAMVCISQCYMIKKEINFKKYIDNSVPYIISGVVMYIILINFKIINIENIFMVLVLKIVFGIILYFALLLIQKYIMKIVKKLV